MPCCRRRYQLWQAAGTLFQVDDAQLQLSCGITTQSRRLRMLNSLRVVSFFRVAKKVMIGCILRRTSNISIESSALIWKSLLSNIDLAWCYREDFFDCKPSMFRKVSSLAFTRLEVAFSVKISLFFSMLSDRQMEWMVTHSEASQNAATMCCRQTKI